MIRWVKCSGCGRIYPDDRWLARNSTRCAWCVGKSAEIAAVDDKAEIERLRQEVEALKKQIGGGDK